MTMRERSDLPGGMPCEDCEQGLSTCCLEPVEVDLFGEAIVEPPPPPVDERSAGVRRTARQLDAIRHGQHPLAGMGPLHPDADRSAMRDDGPNLPLRCGSCIHRIPASGDRSWPKCDVGPRSHSEATDVRAWWPACMQYQPIPKEPTP